MVHHLMLPTQALNMEEASDSSKDLSTLTLPTTEIHLDDLLSKFRFGKFHWKMLILACGAYFSACSEMMLLVFLSGPIKREWGLHDMVFPILPFTCGIFNLTGSFLFGTLSDKFGRQRPLLASLALVTVFGIVSAFAPFFWMFVAMRVFVSMGTSGIETVDFVLLLEFLPKKNRGCTMVVITFCGALGAVFAAGMAWALLPHYGWRWFVGACALPAACTFLYRLFVWYESPRYLFISGQWEKGIEVLKEISRQNNEQLPSGEIVCPPIVKRGRMQDLFSKQLRTQTIFSTLVWFLQSMGFWSVTMYLPEYMGTLAMDPYFSTFTVFAGEIPGMCLAMILIEPHMLGRIKCLRFFSVFTTLGLLLFAFINYNFMRAVFVIVVFCFMAPIYSILNTYTPEVYPTDSRSIAMAWVYMVISLPGLITSFLGATVLSTNIPWLYPTIAASFFCLQFLFTFGLKTESAGQALNERKELVVTADNGDAKVAHDLVNEQTSNMNQL